MSKVIDRSNGYVNVHALMNIGMLRPKTSKMYKPHLHTLRVYQPTLMESERRNYLCRAPRVVNPCLYWLCICLPPKGVGLRATTCWLWGRFGPLPKYSEFEIVLCSKVHLFHRILWVSSVRCSLIVFKVLAENISSSWFTTGWLDIDNCTIQCMCCLWVRTGWS